MKEERLEDRYEKAFIQATGGHPVFPTAARTQMAQMVEAIARGNSNLDLVTSTNQDIAVKAGFVAEEFHSENFNLDAILKGDKARAYTDRYEQWNQYEWNGAPLGKNDIPDIAIVKDGKVTTTAQSKYNASVESTAKEMSQVKDGSPKYKDIDQLLGPSDQVKTTNGSKTITDHAQGRADSLRNQHGDQAEIDAYQQTANKNTDVITDGKSSSSRLSKAEAEKIATGDRNKLKVIENKYKTRSTVKQMSNAAVGAAAMSAVVSGSVNIWRYTQMAKDGEITAEEATVKVIGETVSAAADSAVKAAANTGVQSLIVRYGSEKAALQIVAQQGMKNMLRTNAVTVGVVCAVDAVKDLVQLGMGNLTEDEFYERQGKNMLSTASGVVGGGLGTAAGAGMATAFGAGAGSTAVTVASVVGGIAGGVIAGLAMSLAIENGIERPYRDLLNNTRQLHEATAELERVSTVFLNSHVQFTKFFVADRMMEQQLQRQFQRIDDAGRNALDIINQI